MGGFLTRRMGFKKSLRDTLAENNRADAFYAAMSGKPPQNQAPIAPKRQYVAREGRKEADVIADVTDVLADHVRVLYAMRINSGSAEYINKAGDKVPVWFHKWVRAPEKIAMSDFYGATTDARIIAIECKHPEWTKPTDERERKQAAFLGVVRTVGGIALFCTDASQVVEALRQS